MRNLVYQVHSGPGFNGMDPKTLSLTTASAKSYANACGAEYRFDQGDLSQTIIGQQTPQSIKGEYLSYCYLALNLIYDKSFDQYDHILYLDTDTIIDVDAKNIFKIESIQKHTDIVAANQQTTGYKGCPQSRKVNLMASKLNCQLSRSNDKNREFRFLQTGVVLYTKKGRQKARRTWDDWRQWIKIGNDLNMSIVHLTDQPFINAMASKHNFNVLELSSKWNHIVGNIDDRRKAHIYHFPNNSKKFISNFLQKK